jgi:glycosyltransferase involved in cell wall biosynthesis
MTELPNITVLINTFRRSRELARAIHCLRAYLLYPADKLEWVIADDCSGADYDASFQTIIETFDGMSHKPRILTTPVNSGWGTSANNAIRAIYTPYIFHLDDDFMLKDYLDLTEGVSLLETTPSIGMVRYAAMANGERYNYRQYITDSSLYFILDKSSPSLYLYSQTPRLYGQRWFTRYGFFPETGLTLGEAEEHYCHHVKDIMNTDDTAPQIAVFPEWIRSGFTIERERSWQFTEYDKRHEVKA